MDDNKTDIHEIDLKTGMNNTSDYNSKTQSLITQGIHNIVINVYHD